MNGDAQSKIERIIQDGYDFKFGDYISRGFEIAQKNYGGFIGFTILFLLITVVIGFIPFIGQIANTFFIGPALTVGFFIVANKLWKGQQTEFGDFFKGFDHIGQLALTALVQILIVVASMIPFIFVVKDSGLIQWYMDMMGDPMGMQGSTPPMPPLWSLVLLLPTIYFSVAYGWSYMFVVFYKMPFWDAMESSRKLITKNWIIFFLFMIVVGLIAAAGMIALCVGILFTLPAAQCMIFSAFADVTGLHDEPDEEGDLEQHLIS